MFDKWRNQAAEIERLTRELDFSARQLLFAQQRIDDSDEDIKTLKKELKSERAAKDKFMLRYCDQVSVQNKLYGVFGKDAEPDKKLDNYVSPEEMDRIHNAAVAQREADIADGLDPWEIEHYETIIRDRGLDNLLI